MSISEVSFDEGSVFKDVLKDILEESELQIIQMKHIWYGDLMALITKHKLNNKTVNAIIKFFNKHSNLASSPLSISIEHSDGYAYKSNKIEFYWTYKIIKSNNPIDGVFISPIGPIAIIDWTRMQIYG